MKVGNHRILVRDLMTTQPYCERNMKIGAVHGTGYYYCGIGKDLPAEKITRELFQATLNRRDSAIKRLCMLENTSRDYDSYKALCEQKIRQHVLEAERRMANTSKTVGEVDRAKIFEKYGPSPMKYKKYLNDLDADIKETKAAVDEGLRRLIGFKRIENRKVVDISISVAPWEPSGTMICKVEGDDRGLYWDTDEYVNGVRRKGER